MWSLRTLGSRFSCGLAVLALSLPAAATDEIEAVLKELNASASVKGSEEIKSYPVVFKAYLEMGPPPIEVTEAFNNTTIHPKMAEWSTVSGWAEGNAEMAKALLAVESKTLFGLPYGRANVDAAFREADLVADIGVGGSLRDNQFPYLDAIEVITAFATAESYRLFEVDRVDDALDLMGACIFLLRQCCDREFLDEQLYAISLLIESLENMRDMFYLYIDEVAADSHAEVAIQKLPFLRPDRSRLLLPEGDRVVAAALIKEVFDTRGQPDREKFASTFAAIQSKETPLTRFGAARRWRIVADVHDSEEASLERLGLVYDDWYRRWRVEEYDPILDVSTQFERTNPIRFAAVIYSLEDIEKLFQVRNELIAHVNGTAMVAGICGYRTHFGKFPGSSDMTYAQFARKRSDRDPFDTDFAPFKYRVLSERTPVDTPQGRVFLEPGQCILYSKGLDHEDDRGAEHTDDGAAGDIVLWPPMKAVLRENGMLE